MMIRIWFSHFTAYRKETNRRRRRRIKIKIPAIYTKKKQKGTHNVIQCKRFDFWINRRDEKRSTNNDNQPQQQPTAAVTTTTTNGRNDKHIFFLHSKRNSTR